MSWIGWVSLAAGSLMGGFSRYFLTRAVHLAAGPSFPYGTLAVNSAGCLLIGLFSALSGERFALSESQRLLWMTGFCGAFTTFSALILETSRLAQQGEPGRAIWNVALSLILGFFLFWIGTRVGLYLGGKAS